MAASLTHSQFAAQLVGRSLRHIAGKPLDDKPAIKPVPVTDLERASVGLQQGGQTMFYPLSRDTGVYFDLAGSVVTVWYSNNDFDRGIAALDDALKASGFKVKQLKDDSAGAPKQRVRSYEVDLGDRRVAHVIANYAERGAQPERFLVRVGAQVRKG
jgi:hypothetical protein